MSRDLSPVQLELLARCVKSTDKARQAKDAWEEALTERNRDLLTALAEGVPKPVLQRSLPGVSRALLYKLEEGGGRS